MGVPLMLQEADARRIESLKKRLSAKSKVDVVHAGLDLLERDAERAERVRRWERATKLAAGESKRALRDFSRNSRLRAVE